MIRVRCLKYRRKKTTILTTQSVENSQFTYMFVFFFLFLKKTNDMLLRWTCVYVSYFTPCLVGARLYSYSDPVTDNNCGVVTRLM